MDRQRTRRTNAMRLAGAAVALAAVVMVGSAVARPALATHSEVSAEEAVAVMVEHGLDCVQSRGPEAWWCDRGMDCEFPDDGTSCTSSGDTPTFRADIWESPSTALDIGVSIFADYSHSTDGLDPPAEARAWFTDLIELACPGALPAAAEWFSAPVADADYPGGDSCSARLSATNTFGTSADYRLSFSVTHFGSPSTAIDPCSLLTENDVETVLGVDVDPGRQETLPFSSAPYCAFGTASYELQVNFGAFPGQTLEDRADLLREFEGQVVEEIDQDGLRALWIYSTTLSVHSNALSAPMDDGWLALTFLPLNDAAQASRVSLQPEQREQAIELARIALGLGPVASIAPSISAEPAIQSPTASAGEDGSGAIADPVGSAPAAPGEFVASIATPAAVSTDPPVVLQSALLALAVIFLMPFPAQLFNSTVEENGDEIRGWFAPVGRAFSAAGKGLDSFWRNPVGIGLFLVVSAVLYALLDPAFGLSPEALITLIGIAIGIIVVTVLFALPAILTHRRQGDRPVIEAIPGTLLVGIACVAVSRLADFQPGYLYGLVIGLNFARQLDSRDEGRNGATAAALMLIAAVVAWVGLGLLVDGGATGLLAAILETVLAAVMVAGLEGVVFGLLPLRFLPGEPVYAWNRVVWGALLGIGLFAFFHVLINPASGYLSDTTRTPLFTVIGLLVGFGLLSVGFWGYFRYRPERA